MATAQSKGVKNDFYQFLLQNWNQQVFIVPLLIFAMFHPQTTDIQPCKVESFSMKRSNFNRMTSV